MPNNIIDLDSFPPFCNDDDDDHGGSILKKNSVYITIDDLNDFFSIGKKSAIDIIHINCRSFLKKFNELLQLINLVSGSLTAIAVTETWLSAATQDLYCIPGYKFVSSTRPDKTGGAVGIFVPNHFNFTVRYDLCRINGFIECIFVSINLPPKGKFKIILGCVYRPTNSEVDLYNCEIVDLLKIIDQEGDCMVLIAGDYNL